MTAPAPARPRPGDAFLAALAGGNPFGHHRVTATGAQPVDVPSIHDAEFRDLVALAGRAHGQNEAVGAVVWGESGSGKSNLLRRLGEWGATGKAVLVNFLELQAAPDRLQRAVLNAVVGALANGPTPPWHRTPLYALLEGLIRQALPAGKKLKSPAELDELFRRRMAALVAVVGPLPAARQAGELLLTFFKSALAQKTRKGEGATATTAIRRLSGDGLDDDEAKATGLRPLDAANPLDAADSATTLAVLAQVVHAGGQPLVLCFDQINNLPRPQIADVSRLLHDLNDRLRNALLVLSEVQSELMKLTDAAVIPQATWDRLSANKVEVQRVPVAQGRRILEARLEQFLTPFEGEAEVKRHAFADRLFPLGEAWFADRFKNLTDIRPRRMIDAARERWEELQKSLDAASDKAKWLEQWPNFGIIKPPVRKPEELIDEQVEKEVGGRVAKHTAKPGDLPPNADNLCGLVESLLAAGGVGLAVERTGTGSAYDLLVKEAGAGGRGEQATGLVFVTSGNAVSVAAALRRPLDDKKRPARVLLVTDARVPLALGKLATAKGRKYYDDLKKLPGFEHLTLPLSEYAALEALDTVARQAADLEISPHGAPARPLKKDEVFASYRRTGRLKAHPLLGRFPTEAAKPDDKVAITDADLRTFLGGRLALTIGDDTPGLARQFLNGLPADRRAGLDVAACRARVEAVARVMADAGEIAMTQLPDGFFLLPKRRPAAR